MFFLASTVNTSEGEPSSIVFFSSKHVSQVAPCIVPRTVITAVVPIHVAVSVRAATHVAIRIIWVVVSISIAHVASPSASVAVLPIHPVALFPAVVVAPPSVVRVVVIAISNIIPVVVEISVIVGVDIVAVVGRVPI